MGSRIMHYCIATLISEKLKLEDKDHFVLGGIAPDVHPYMNISKDITHFIERDELGKGSINYFNFIRKYQEQIADPFYLGYLCHLISDDIWSKDIYYKIVEFNTKEERKEILKINYRDFWRLNGRIIKNYSLSLVPLSIPNKNIEEINLESMPLLLNWIEKDFAYDESTASEHLELFENDNSQITDYIDKSVKKSLEMINKLMI